MIVLLLSWLSATLSRGLSARLHWRAWIALPLVLLPALIIELILLVVAGVVLAELSRYSDRLLSLRYRDPRQGIGYSPHRTDHAIRNTHHVRTETSMANLTTTLFGISMPSPFILASGPLSYDATGLWEAYRAGAGGVVTKTLRLEAAINPTPHMVVPRSSTCARRCSTRRSGPICPGNSGSRRSCPRWQAIPGC